MDVFNNTDEVVEAIYTAKDAVERKAAIRVAVKFALHDVSGISRDMDTSKLTNKVLMSLLLLSIQNMKPKKGGS